jgi:hypothetical protein
LLEDLIKDEYGPYQDIIDNSNNSNWRWLPYKERFEYELPFISVPNSKKLNTGNV